MNSNGAQLNEIKKLVEDKLIKCNRCEGDACYPQKVGKITLYSCYGCGFQTSTIMKQGEKFFEEQMEDARQRGILFCLHVKATMMKVSHPIVFGHAVKIFYKDLFVKYGELFEKLGVNPDNGIGSVYEKIESLPSSFSEEILRDIHACYESRPEVAMVDSTKGISNLHAPNDVIVDASMPALLPSFIT